VHDQVEGELFARATALAPIAAVVAAAARTGADVYLVGGTVRDLIIGRPFLDVDIAVDGDALELAAELGTPDGGETRFGTITVNGDALRYDVARTRCERYPHPGALPEVAPAGIDADLERRDFSVNALALGLAGTRAGRLVASAGALDDLEHKRLAVLHDDSFVDDPTRLLRLARYAARLRFEPSARTRELAAEAIAGDALGSVSGTRIGNELRLLAGEPDPVAAFEAVAALGLPWSIDTDKTRKALDVLPEDGRADLLVLASVFSGWPSERLVPELDRLGFTAGDRFTIVQAAAAAAALTQRLSIAAKPSEIAQAVGTSGVETVALAFGQGSPPQALAWLQDLRYRTLDITGEDLLQNGMPEGPEIGRALARARAALLDGLAPDRMSQLEVALSGLE
jgi:tRNA nucleotidyltransferase (CCA-adding enzyme)